MMSARTAARRALRAPSGTPGPEARNSPSRVLGREVMAPALMQWPHPAAEPPGCPAPAPPPAAGGGLGRSRPEAR